MPAIRYHWDWIGRQPCCVCHGGPTTIHHCHGGSIAEAGLHKGLGQKTSDWLVIPLCPDHHVGRHGIDGAMGVKRWEAAYGSQLEHLRQTCSGLPYDPMALGGLTCSPAPG